MQAVIDLDIPSLQSAWIELDRQAHLRPIRSGSDYARMVALMNDLLDTVGDNESHVLFGLLEVVGELVSDYDVEHHGIEATEPREALLFLMERRGMKQTDLAGIIAQGNLSAILSGKRKINASLAGKLGEFFSVSPSVFIPPA